MLRCGHCEVICESYEDWLSHLVSEGHQAKLGMSEVFNNHKDVDRNERSLLMTKMNPKSNPYDVVCHFAQAEPLGFITDAYAHLFPSVHEKFYLIVFDQKKFVDRISQIHERCGDQKVLTSMVHCQSKASLSEKDWKAKLEASFFYRRHEHLRKTLIDLGWEEQFKQFLSIVSLNGEGYQQREKLMEELESLIREDYEEATVSPFGSCTTWLADTNADLDVYVDALGKGGRNDIDYEIKADIMYKVEKLLRRQYEGRNVFAIRNARIPIIQLSHPSGLKVDVSFENCLSVQNSRMIRLMTKLDYRVRPLLVFLRYWARYHNLIGPQYVKSYALMLMALVFLRKKKILPTVHDIQTVEGTRPFEVCGWNATFCNSREVIQRQVPGLKCVKEAPCTDRNAQEIMQLAYGFFLEFSTFDFDTQVICPIVGEYLPKVSFDSLYGKDLPKEMELLKANLVTCACTGFPTRKPLCIQDPFTLNINVTSSCNNPDVVCKFKAACSMAAEALKPFATIYDSADKEAILDLCCQQVTTEKQQEIMMRMISDNAEENHDNMAYVKTEATTTTNDDEHYGEFVRSSDSTSAPDHKSSSSDALQSIKDFYKDNFNYKGFSGSEEKDRNERAGSSRDRSSDRHRDRERDNPSRVQRVSMSDSSEKASSSGSGSYHLPQSYPGYTVPTSPDQIPDESTSKTNKDEKERRSPKKAMRSVIVVANKSSSKTDLGTAEKSSPPHASPTSSPYSSKVSANDKSLKDIVIRVENNPVKATDSPEPVVKFVASSLPSPEHFQSFVTQVDAPTPQIPPPEISTNFDSDNNYGYAIVPKTPFTATTPESKKAKKVKQAETPKVKQVETPKMRQAETPKVKKAETPKAKSIKNYIPPNTEEIEEPVNNASSPRVVVDAEVTPEPPRSELYFPAFVVYLSDNFCQSFYGYLNLKNISMFENVLLTKMKVLWTTTVLDMFCEGNVWTKLKPIIGENSFSSVKLDDDKMALIFEEVDRTSDECLANATSAYIHNRKRPHAGNSSSDESFFDNRNERGPSPKVRKTSSTSGQSVSMNSSPLTSYESQASLLLKLGKVAANVRKRSSSAYFFRIHPSILTLLKNEWERLSSDMQTKYPGTSPLDMFGKICEQIKVTLVNVPPQVEWINVKMLVAFDTSSDPPGLYFGFEFEHRLDDPTYDRQAGIHVTLEAILTDLIEAHAMYIMGKLFIGK